MSFAKQEFVITDVVEMGHFTHTGGTVEISLHFKEVQSPELVKKYLKVIDTLDHCLVTDNVESTTYSARYYLLDKSSNLFEDVVSIITNQMLDCYHLQKITVKYDKFKYTSEPVLYVDVLEFAIEG